MNVQPASNMQILKTIALAQDLNRFITFNIFQRRHFMQCEVEHILLLQVALGCPSKGLKADRPSGELKSPGLEGTGHV
jgi:hypothetical protein